MKSPSRKIQDQCEWSMEATAIFDALGLPTENLKEEKIAQDMPTAANEYLRCPSSHPYKGHEPGHWSDDTQLSLAVAKAIAKDKGDVCMRTIAEMHVEAARETIMGWGGATRESVKRLAENDLAYHISGKEGAVGNGVVMKMTPLALAMHYHPDFKDNERGWLDTIEEFTQMTHRSSVALVSSAVHADMLTEILVSDPASLKSKEARINFISRAVEGAKKYEAEFGESGKQLSQRLQGLLDHFDELSQNSTLLSISNGGDCFVPDTLTMCYGLLASDFSFKSAFRAVMIGGDTDSNASIVGSMVGLTTSITQVPQNLRRGLWRKEEITKTSREFAKSLLGVAAS